MAENILLNQMKIGNPSIIFTERDYLWEAIDKGEISKGDFIPRFEKAWANNNGRKHGVSCNSGTSALELALLSLGIMEGDEVIVPEFTMAACAFAVSNVGATPIFVDCLDDLTTDPMKVIEAITPKTKAIMIVPIYGRMVSKKVYEIALDHKLFIVEDFAEGHGIKPKGDITCYSFQANKIITTGEGGMCLTDDDFIAKEIRKLSELYFDNGRTMIHGRVAHNYRMTNLHAAIGLAQVERFTELKNKRIQIAKWYDKYLPKGYLMPQRDVVWVYDISVIERKQEKVMRILAENGVETRYGFKPMSMQPPYLGEYEHLNAYKWSKKIIYLPTYYDMDEMDVKFVCDVIRNIK